MGQEQSSQSKLYLSVLPIELLSQLFSYFTFSDSSLNYIFDSLKDLYGFQILFDSEQLRRNVWTQKLPPNVKIPENLSSRCYLILLNEQLNIKVAQIKRFAEEGQAMKLYPLLMHKYDYNLAMEYAAKGGHWSIIQRMLELGADNINWAMVYAAKKQGNINIIEKLLTLGANDYNRTLIWASRSGDIQVVNRMLQLGANNFYDILSNAVFEDNHRLLSWAVNYAGRNNIPVDEKYLYFR